MRRVSKFKRFSFDVACVQCGHAHSYQQVQFACLALHVASCLLCGLGLKCLNRAVRFTVVLSRHRSPGYLGSKNCQLLQAVNSSIKSLVSFRGAELQILAPRKNGPSALSLLFSCMTPPRPPTRDPSHSHDGLLAASVYTSLFYFLLTTAR